METNTPNQAPVTNNQNTANNQNQEALSAPAIEKLANNSVSQEFQNILADIESLVRALTSLTGSELEAAKAQLKQRIATAKLTLAEVRSNVAKQACNTISATDTYVHEQPWRAVGASAAIGFLLGLILARRN